VQFILPNEQGPPVKSGVVVAHAHEEGVRFDVAFDDEQGLRTPPDRDSFPLTDGEKVRPGMFADHATVVRGPGDGGGSVASRGAGVRCEFGVVAGDFHDVPRARGKLHPQEIRQVDLADKTQALAVFLFGRGKAVCSGPIADLGFAEVPDGEEGVR
jgi:hypothetical protein